MRTERYFTLRLRAIWRPRLSASRLCYTIHTECQYQGIVKVPGSFRPSALNEHLYSYCNFAELLAWSVPPPKAPTASVFTIGGLP